MNGASTESGSESSISLPLSLGAHVGNPALLPLGRVLSYAMQDVLLGSENRLKCSPPGCKDSGLLKKSAEDYYYLVDLTSRVAPRRKGSIRMGRSYRSRPKRLGQKLRLIRHELGLSQSAMVKALNVRGEPLYPASISLYENGKREPPLIVLLHYARLVGICTDRLIDDKLELFGNDQLPPLAMGHCA